MLKTFRDWPHIIGQHVGLISQTIKNTIMCNIKRQHFVFLLLTRLEPAYSLICGALQIWGQDLGTFILSRPN